MTKIYYSRLSEAILQGKCIFFTDGKAYLLDSVSDYDYLNDEVIKFLCSCRIVNIDSCLALFDTYCSFMLEERPFIWEVPNTNYASRILASVEQNNLKYRISSQESTFGNEFFVGECVDNKTKKCLKRVIHFDLILCIDSLEEYLKKVTGN